MTLEGSRGCSHSLPTTNRPSSTQPPSPRQVSRRATPLMSYELEVATIPSAHCTSHASSDCVLRLRSARGCRVRNSPSHERGHDQAILLPENVTKQPQEQLGVRSISIATVVFAPEASETRPGMGRGYRDRFIAIMLLGGFMPRISGQTTSRALTTTVANPSSSTSGSATSWSALPTAITTTFEVTSGESVLLLAHVRAATCFLCARIRTCAPAVCRPCSRRLCFESTPSHLIALLYARRSRGLSTVTTA